MIARVSLEIALRREFDYAIPPELADKVDVGSRVQVPFGARKVLGCVTALAEESALLVEGGAKADEKYMSRVAHLAPPPKPPLEESKA